MGFVRLAILGNLVRDPETRIIANGDAACSFSVACNIWRGQNKDPLVHYVRCTAWRKMAEVCQNALVKGQGVVVWGKGGVHAWNDTRDGSPRGNLELEVEGFDFAGRRPETAQMRRRPERSPRRAPGNPKKRVRKPRRSCRARQSCRTLCAAMPACSGAQPAI